jgi:hypothetical protein
MTHPEALARAYQGDSIRSGPAFSFAGPAEGWRQLTVRVVFAAFVPEMVDRWSINSIFG